MRDHENVERWLFKGDSSGRAFWTNCQQGSFGLPKHHSLEAISPGWASRVKREKIEPSLHSHTEPPRPTTWPAAEWSRELLIKHNIHGPVPMETVAVLTATASI